MPQSVGPRIAPVDDDLAGLPPLNMLKTLAKHPALMQHWNAFGGWMLHEGLLPARERELVILRVGWRCRSIYEFGQHTERGTAAGLTADEISRLGVRATDGWSPPDRDLVDMVDELCAGDEVSEATWQRLAARWSEAELLELLFLAGMYRVVSGYLNTVAVELEPGVPGWPVAAEQR